MIGTAVNGRQVQYIPCRRVMDPAVVAAEAEEARTLAMYLQARGQARCVDQCYNAALLAWQSIEGELAIGGASQRRPAAWGAYQDCLMRLLVTAQQHHRIGPQHELLVETAAGPHSIPTCFFGFAWREDDFDLLVPARDVRADAIARRHASPGLGAALVAVRIADREETFFRTRQPFAATAVLRTRSDAVPIGFEGNPANASDAVLEFYNPLVFDRVVAAGVPLAIARDLTAPLNDIVQESPPNYLEGFIQPSETDVRPKLIMMEPYQPGKIPVVFVHGLASDTQTWYDLLNDLRAQPDLYERFQFWAFHYPTGGAILESIAELRQRLALARESCDPDHADPALDRIVLIAHSMGGIVSKLQVTYSYDILWRRVARQSFDAVRADPEMLERLERMFFFEPNPSIARVVFIGTPHRGSGWSRRAIGRVSSNLVRFGAAEDAQYRALMDSNRGVFNPYLQKRRLTSIDLLEPDSPLLAAYQELPLNPCVRLHSIIGTGGHCGSEPGDGVVPVSSARLPGVESELYVPARHSRLQRDPATVAEITRILREHAAELTNTSSILLRRRAATLASAGRSACFPRTTPGLVCR